MNMKAASFLIGITIFGVIMLITPIPVNAQASPCKCEDKVDLIDQLNKASAAMKTISDLLQTMKSQNDLVAKIPADSNPKQMSWKEIIDGAVYQAGYSVSSLTEPTSCEFKVLASSACLKSLAAKIAVDRKAVLCPSASLTVRDYLLRLSRIYKKDIAEIVARLSALQKSCRPTDWIGTIRYSFDQRNSNRNEKPGLVETIEDTLKIDGIIKLNGDHALEYPSSWEAGGKYEENKESKGSRPCKGGLATAKLDGKYESKHIFKWDKNGQISRDTDVSIGDVQEGNKVTIDFRLPKIVMKTSGYSKDSYVSNCPKPNGDFDGPPTPWDVEFPLDSQMINFVGSYFPGNPDKISGSVTLESGKTGTVIVTYNLFKLKP